MRKIITRSLCYLMVFVMVFGITGTTLNVKAEDTTSAVQKIVVAAVTMNDAATRTTLANNITNIDANGDSLGYLKVDRKNAITAAFSGVHAYLLQPGYIDAVITKMDAQSIASKILIRKVIIEGAPTVINYDRTNFKDTALYNKLNDMITGGHSNDNGIKFLVKLLQSTAEVYNKPVASDGDSLASDIKFEITGFHKALADALFSELMVSFETLNNLITDKAGPYATYSELLAYSAGVVNATSDEAAFKRLLKANSIAGYPIYSGSVDLLPIPLPYTPPTPPVTPPTPPVTPPTPPVTPPTPPVTPPTPPVTPGTTTIDAGTVTNTTSENGEKVSTVEVSEQAVDNAIENKELESVSLDLTAVKGSAEVLVELTGAMIDKIADNGKGIEIKSEKATLVIPEEVVRQMSQASGNEKVTISINVVGTTPTVTQSDMKIVAPVLEFGIKAGEQEITSFEDAVKAEMQVDMSKVKDYRKVIASYYNEETKVWEAVNGYLNKQTGVLVFFVTHFSKYTAAEYKKSFADVDSQWAIGDIEVLAARNIMNGIGKNKFAPKANITRAEVAAIITRALRLDTQAATGEFSDVPTTKWYAKEIEAAAKAGIVNGIGNGKFAPEKQITREEIAVMIFRALEYRQGKTSSIPKLTFTDASETASYAKNAVAVVASKDIIRGFAGKFNPKDKATREQAAVMIYRLLAALGEM